MESIIKSSDRIDGRGVCPYCDYPSYFTMHGGAHTCHLEGSYHFRCICECQNCRRPILLVCEKGTSQSTYGYSAHYPTGKPNEIISDDIPEEIGIDFKEALRCQFVNAHRATATMCRRALQSSCQDLGATGDYLFGQIDNLAEKGKITAALQEMAHAVRLVGNVGAHPDEDGLKDVSSDDASDLIEFSRQFYDHVYVMPAKLREMKERQERSTNPSTE